MWLEALPQAGFEKVDFILDDDDDYPSCSIICATVVGDEDLKRSIQPSEKKQSTTVVRLPSSKFLASLLTLSRSFTKKNALRRLLL